MDKPLLLHGNSRGPLTDLLASAGHLVERRLPRRYWGRIARFVGLRKQWFIAPEIGGREAFLAALRKRGIAHVMLEELVPASYLRPDSLALLFDDEEVPVIRPMLTNWPVGEPVAAFSTTGLPGFAFGDMPLLPPVLAREILSHARDDRGHKRPFPQHAVLMHIYRLLYFSGYNAGIGSELNAESGAVSPEFADVNVLAELARDAGLSLPETLTLEALDELMQRHGWKPPIEFLERLAVRNAWIAEGLERAGEWKGAEAPGWAVFYIRERVVEEGKIGTVLDALRGQGFDLPQVPELSAEQLRELSREVRGGNWGRGPFPVSGGEPALVVVGYDANPLSPDDDMLAEFPLLDNARIQHAKRTVRNALHKDLSKSRRYNGLHSTDNSVQAWRAIREMYPGAEVELRAIGRRG